jgi:hypothetical protein
MITALSALSDRNKLVVKAVDARQRDYARGVRSLVYSLWRGYTEQNAFIHTMVYAIERNIMLAWAEGAKACGISEEELTLEEISARKNLINSQYPYLIDFADAIIQGSRDNNGKLTPLYRRAEMWVNRFNEARNQAKQMACGDKKLMWVMNPLKEHCTDCLMLNGKVYRASVWKKYDLRPQMRKLECHGYKCGCSFTPTDDPATPGHPPII